MLHRTATVQLLVATLLFGSGNVVQKSVFETVDVWSSLGLRGLVAFIVLLPFAFQEAKGLKHVRIAECIGMLQPMAWFTLGMTLQLYGATLTTATNVGFLINMSVVFTPLLCWFLFGHRPGLNVVVASGLCLLGMAMLSGSTIVAFSPGDAYCLLSAVAFSAWMITLSRFMNQLQVPISITCLQWFMPAVIGLVVGAGRTTTPVIVDELPAIVFLGAVAGGFGFLLAARAQANMSAGAAAICYTMEAVFGAAIAFWWLGETLTIAGFAGALLTLSGIVLLQFGGLAVPVVRQRRFRPLTSRNSSVFNIPS